MCVDGQIAVVLDSLKSRRRDIAMASRRLPLQRRHAVLARVRRQTLAMNAEPIGRIASLKSSAVIQPASIVTQARDGHEPLRRS
jgi:hypothetical protein